MSAVEWTDAAREAAARAWARTNPTGAASLEGMSQHHRDLLTVRLKAVLGALAPFVAAREAQAAATALRRFHRDLGEGCYADTSVYVALLDAADQIERGESS